MFVYHIFVCIPFKVFVVFLSKWYKEPRFVVVVMEKLIGVSFLFEPFNCKNNFTLWQSRVKDLLIQQGLYVTLEHKKPTDMKNQSGLT